jgi:hypothetical protein
MLLTALSQHPITPPLHRSIVSLDDFIRPHEHVGRNSQADPLGGFPVEYKFNLRGLLDGAIGRLCSFRNIFGSLILKSSAPSGLGHG